MPQQYDHMPLGQWGLKFAQTLVDGDFAATHCLLTPTLQDVYPVAALQTAYSEMIAYWETPEVELIEANALLEDWPDKQPDDWGWVYLSINGVGNGEAITIVVTQAHQVREIEWGRP